MSWPIPRWPTQVMGALAGAVLMLSCHPGVCLTVVQDTGGPVYVWYEDSQYLEPGAEVSYGVRDSEFRRHGGTCLFVREESGDILFQRILRRDDFDDGLLELAVSALSDAEFAERFDRPDPAAEDCAPRTD